MFLGLYLKVFARRGESGLLSEGDSMLILLPHSVPTLLWDQLRRAT
jgi:hypothetical protein